MPSLEERLNLRARLCELGRLAIEREKAGGREPPLVDDEALAAYGFAPDFDSEFSFHQSLPFFISDVTSHLPPEENLRRLNVNFAYVEGQTSTLWDAFNKLDTSLTTGQQSWERDFAELRSCTLQLISNNDDLSRRLSRASEQLEQQANDIAELRTVVNNLRAEQGTMANWEVRILRDSSADVSEHITDRYIAHDSRRGAAAAANMAGTFR